MDQSIAQSTANKREIHICLFGVYGWEFFISLWFEYRLCSLKLPFKWPLIPYFLARYLGLGAAIGNVLLVSMNKPINCHVLFQSVLFIGNAAIFFSTFNFMVRAIIIWVFRWYILVPLITIAIGHFVLLTIGFKVEGGVWDGDAQVLACIHSGLDADFLGAYSIYTAVFDLIILVTCIVGLGRTKIRSSFADALCVQGITYFVIILILYMMVVISVFVTHNIGGSKMIGSIATAMSPVLSCRMVRSTFETPPSNEADMNPSNSWHWWCVRSSRESSDTADEFSTHVDLEAPPNPASHSNSLNESRGGTEK